ncbi:hypothetical protein [Texcoconibacillus texcoconensis]|uniref:Uncharacterized protein n=1 Tax=Texcoconibacillus texcoconensis TaxID=1095777 RepID=A0A840QQS1_9BACI|nr:hypothetical protein [Texcoconibacillus texcoconensis]MBB5173792.1 hypothetical protein [Texcoconibacillus texcoconensis]
MKDEQQKMMSLMVRKILQRHNVDSTSQLDDSEKEQLQDIVTKIQGQVERFLEEHEKKITEQDFPEENQSSNNTTSRGVEITDGDDEAEGESQVNVQQSPPNNEIVNQQTRSGGARFQAPNDVSQVKMWKESKKRSKRRRKK